MATIIERPRVNRPSSWQVQIRIPGCKAVSRSFETEAEARDFASVGEAKIRRLSGRSTSRTQRSFYKEQFKSAILDYVSSGSCSSDEKKIATTICKHIGTISTGEIKRKTVKEYVSRMLMTHSSMKRPFKASTLAKHISLMGKIYRWRADELDADAPPSPFSVTVLPKGWNVGRERRLSESEQIALMNRTRGPRRAYGRHWRLLIQLALETAARQQELGLAQWAEFDLEKGLWRMPAAHTKTKKNRIVALSPRAKRVLRALMAIRSTSDERLFHCFASISSISSGFKKIAAKAGLIDFHFHDLRHEAISRMIARRGSVSPFLIMKMVGHNSTEMLARYCNATGDDMMGAFG